jgi:hypothetical protein
VQQKIYIEDFQDGIVLLKDGGLRAIIMTSSINFSLKSTEEQEALIYKYQGFLNSLDFPVQILIISRRLNIAEYLSLIEQKKREQSNELLRIQIVEYVDFIKNLVQVSNIMSQSFYLIIPLSRVEKKQANIIERLGILQKKSGAEEKSLEELKTQLWQRVDYVVAGLNGLGLKSAPLNTEEAAELFYRLYNMEAKESPTLISQQSAL